MDWLGFVGSSVFLESLFPGGGPSLEIVSLHEIQLLDHGQVINFRFDLVDFPLNPPKKWSEQKDNTVQVVLMGIGVRGLKLSGWTSDIVGKLELKVINSGIGIRFTSDCVDIQAEFDFVEISRVSAYHSGLRT